MKTKIILLLSIVMLTFACKHTQKTTTTGAPAVTIYRVIVSFGSNGTGIDAKTAAGLESWALSYGKKVGKTIKYSKVNYGKEGEVDYCFDLTNLSKSKQDECVQDIKNCTKAGSLVKITENSACTHASMAK